MTKDKREIRISYFEKDGVWYKVGVIVAHTKEILEKVKSYE